MTVTALVAMLADMLKILASPGGDAMLTALFVSHGLTPESVAAFAAAMPDTPDPKKKE